MNGGAVAATVAAFLTGVFIADRAVKSSLVARFFARPTPAPPANGWPSVALIQPVTHGATRLEPNLHARAELTYPGTVQHIVVCDDRDTHSQAVCQAALPTADLTRCAPDLPGLSTASKVAKMAAGVEKLGGVDVVCFVDDDICLPPDALQALVAPLYGEKPFGAAFGLACQVSWATVWESLMSGFVNANALTGYIPLTFFTPPYTVTGHVFALRAATFAQTGSMDGMARRFDDDHEIARRVRALGLPLAQTPLVYQVANALPSAQSYFGQMRRWFTMPKQAMVSFLTPREKTVSGLLSLGNMLPPVVLLLALCAPTKTTWLCVLVCFAAFAACYRYLEARYLPARTPLHGLLLLPVLAFLTPLHVLLALLLPGDRIVWRGQTLHAKFGGGLEAGNS